MDYVQNLLDAAKTKSHATNDTDLAAVLHVTKSAVSGWRTGKAHPDEVACARLAAITGEPLARVLGVVGEARARSPSAKRVWRLLAQGASGAILIAAATLLAPTPANAAPSDTWGVSTPLYIMSIYQ